MRSLRAYFLLVLVWLGSLASVCAVEPETTASTGTGRGTELSRRVVILANANDSQSLRLAQTYAHAREIPAANIIALPLAPTESISWEEFLTTLWHPLQEKLLAERWIDAIPMETRDPIGRRKLAPSAHRISYLVICRGVPLRVENDSSREMLNPPITNRREFRHNIGAVDAELPLIAVSTYPINGFIPNPWFGREGGSGFEQEILVKVSRLDGPTLDAAENLIISAQEGERDGLIGRYLVDLGGPHADGDRWLEQAARQLTDLSWDGEVDRAGSTVTATARVDQLALYFGWYTDHVNGPFVLPGFRFAPGAIALHIHSFSARTLRSPLDGWSGPFVARGVAGTVGNVSEPYLQLTHQPHLLLQALLRGETFGDAIFYALPALSWQAVAIGDPLYRPFAFSREQQWNGRDRVGFNRAGYLVAARARTQAAAGKFDEAVELAEAFQRKTAHPALALEESRILSAQGEPVRARTTLERAASLSPAGPTELALFAEIARELAKLDRPATAVHVWRNVLRSSEFPASSQEMWLKEALESARAARDETQVQAWRRELSGPAKE